MTLCMHCHLWIHGRCREGRPGTPHPLWRGCMWKKYGKSPWTHGGTFGHKQQVHHNHSQVIAWHPRAGQTRRSHRVPHIRLDREPVDPGVVGGARCCHKVQVLLAVLEFNLPPNPKEQQFDHALMQTCHGIARCVCIAMQGLGEQRREPVSEDSLVAA